uniref:Beta-carotene isomerase D27-like C-terminal domain-containing protein n=1 Tax=Ananas comosus var. bracteatus TaxID=296719 RepID=A0A6V7PQT1_ANACO|nr:unnamed protein product [Ananas comosus var. bracteatus]
MGALLLLRPAPLPLSYPPHHPLQRRDRLRRNPRSRVACSPTRSEAVQSDATRKEYEFGFVDEVIYRFFRKKMVEEVGWDSEKPGYDGLIEVVNRMMKGRSYGETEESAVRVIRSLFPPFLLVFFKRLIAPLFRGRIASMMSARATVLSCQWLMGPCSVKAIELPDGSTCSSGVFIEKCKYLEESKCVGLCINTCKRPTQAFFREYMGVPLYMEPNFSDFSCQFNFGVLPPEPANDKALAEPCLEICPNATRRKELNRRDADITKCPQA